MSEPSSKPKLSTAPSWVMVGFVIGALFSWGVQRELARRHLEAAPAAPPPVSAPVETPKSPAVMKERASLVAVENIFAQYGSNAVWRNDITEFALWNAETNKFSECFEAVRTGELLHFRTISHLTRPVIRPNPVPDAPIRFTEPEEVQLERLQKQPAWLPPSTDPDR
ncbi:MAG: hypothetical protein QM790_12575 [Nibricoccus sp.]